MTYSLSAPLSASALVLARQRPLTSLIECEILPLTGCFEEDRSNWVHVVVDRGHAVRSDCGTMTAHRAITRQGQLLWMVSATGKQHAYHATASCPFAAMEDAAAAWERRRAVRQRWDEVEATAGDLLRGRQRFSVTRGDADASPLCTLGIDGFLARIGLARVKRIPGWLAALLMRIEPQMGFVIFEAMTRQAEGAGKRPARVGGPTELSGPPLTVGQGDSDALTGHVPPRAKARACRA